MPDRGTCKSCGAAILWAKTPAGKAMPLDAEPQKRIVLGRVTGEAHVLDTYVPHWATCPSAAQHRAPRPEAAKPRPCIVVVDTETTGLDPTAHEVIDVAAVLVDAGTFEVLAEAGGRCPLLRPDRAHPEALRVNGYTPEAWATARPLEEVLPEVLGLVARAEAWLGSNPGFDVDFVGAAAGEVGLSTPALPRLIDTAQLASGLGVRGPGRRPHSLDALCELYGVEGLGEAHTARADCFRALEVYRRLREVV
jgi:DNA polymerase III epsilon subunit-like protein